MTEDQREVLERVVHAVPERLQTSQYTAGRLPDDIARDSQWSTATATSIGPRHSLRIGGGRNVLQLRLRKRRRTQDVWLRGKTVCARGTRIPLEQNTYDETTSSMCTSQRS